MYRQAAGQTDRWDTQRKIDRQIEIQTDRWTYGQMDKWVGIKTDRWDDDWIDRQTDRHTYRWIEIHKYIHAD